MISCISFFFFFFFQAEDGIRDHCVTGVQTCALPIWVFRGCRVGVRKWVGPLMVLLPLLLPSVAPAQQSASKTETSSTKLMRSEERRVGKECRSRRAQYH